MEHAAFKLIDYNFSKTIVDYSFFSQGEIDVLFDVRGDYDKSESKYFLYFTTTCKIEDSSDPFIVVKCQGEYKFKNVASFNDIPKFFYINCIAILFPYVRSYISTITVQSNIKPIILPTLNLTKLSNNLIESSKEIE